MFTFLCSLIFELSNLGDLNKNFSLQCVTEVDSLLSFTDGLLTESGFQRAIASSSTAMFRVKYERLKAIIPLHAEAHDAGIISLQHLIDVLVTPFLKLALAINQLSQSGPIPFSRDSPEEFRNMLLMVWGVSLRNALTGVADEDSMGVQSYSPLLSHAKRRDLVKYLLERSPLQVWHRSLAEFLKRCLPF